MIIESYKNEGTRDIAEGINSKESRKILPSSLHNVARLKMVLLSSAESLLELSTVPGLNLEQLKGDRIGKYSVRINKQYRL